MLLNDYAIVWTKYILADIKKKKLSMKKFFFFNLSVHNILKSLTCGQSIQFKLFK